MPFLTDRIAQTQRAQKLAAAMNDENLLPAELASRAAPRFMPASRFTFDLAMIERELRGNIVGQDEMIASVMRIMTVICADIGDPRKPLASFLFAGPTGVGKTETVRVLARALHGDADAFCRVDMNTLAQEHYAAALTGAPPGYVGSKEGTTILDQDKIEGSHDRPGIVLFDELEKASDEVVLALLNVLDNGILTVASGERTYSFRNAIVFMTTNLGASELMERAGVAKPAGRGKRAQPQSGPELVLEKLLKRFPPEFVNRIDQIETFNAIGTDFLPAIVEVEIGKLNRRLLKHDCHLEVGPEVMRHLAELGYDKRFGARGLRRMIRKHLEFPLAEYLLSAAATGSSVNRRIITAVLEGQTLTFVEGGA